MTLSIDLSDEELEKILLGDRGKDLLMEKVFNQILQAEMTEHLGADRYERSQDRSGHRNGSYERQLTTRVGQLTLEVPRCKDGSFSTKLFQRYQRSEKALVLALMEMVVQGVSTRRVKKITTELCGREFSKSTVSRLAKDLDEQVQAWAERPLQREYPFLMLDAMQLKVRRQKAVRSTTAMIAVGISEDGQREILGIEMALSETEEGWRRFIRGLKERGLSGVEMATSDAHEGLKQALQEAFPGLIWQRCQSHFRRNVLDQTPSDYRDQMHEVLDQILEASSQKEARTRLDDLRERLEEKAPSALETLEDGFYETTAVLALPEKYRKRLLWANMPERFIQEIRRREKVIRIFPNMNSAKRLVGALCAEKHEEWSTGRRYLTMDEYFGWKTDHAVENPLDGSTSLNGEATAQSTTVPT
ncbi:transposase-like protein [Salinibacter ruber]|uniref:IS256 family transposase n=1 Tax=Salinibacter ruber TaxID=146919 RepID=UPI002167404E|nr:IS256 family transposase [Salinibacter ruber]MCS4048034.1 transposase-like protein [Salinibacter ruber]